MQQSEKVPEAVAGIITENRCADCVNYDWQKQQPDQEQNQEQRRFVGHFPAC